MSFVKNVMLSNVLDMKKRFSRLRKYRSYSDYIYREATLKSSILLIVTKRAYLCGLFIDVPGGNAENYSL